MIKIDEEMLLDDLLLMSGPIADTNQRGIFLRDFNNYEILNDMMGANYGKYIDYEPHIRNPQSFDEYLFRIEKKAMLSYVNFYAQNKDLLKRMATQYLNYLRKIRYPIIKSTLYVRGFSEKDFIDVILSYYAQFGDSYYETAKRYFDEGRINMCTEDMQTTHPAFFSGLQAIDSGYIFLKGEDTNAKYSSYNANTVVHELGHAMDFENFIVKQQKDMPIFSDLLSEVPSTAFEIGFADFLRDNHIDTIGCYTLDYCNAISAKCDLKDLKAALNSPNPFTFAHPGKVETQVIKSPVDESEDAEESEITIEVHTEEPPLLRKSTIYGLGALFGYNLNAIRRSSNKEFAKVLHNICTSRKEASLEQLIAMTGFNHEDFVTGRYIKPQIEESAMVLKKKYYY